MRACLYARKSTAEDDKHEQAKSCEQQLTTAAQFCQRRGWTVVQTFRDDQVSGAEFVKRPGVKALMEALGQTPRPFDVVVVMESSRLGRDTARSLMMLSEIEDAGCEVWSYLEGERISLESESDELKAVFKALGARSERRKASERTYAAMRLRFQNGAQLGGAPYGYRVHRNGGPYAGLVVEPAEAQLVRDVFRWYGDEGMGLGAIVRRHNAAGVPAPRGGAKGWGLWTIGLLLRRGTYAGMRSWNRSKTTMRRGTKHRDRRASGDWLTIESPELALIDRGLWERTQARMASREAFFLRTHEGKLIGRPRGGDDAAVYVLSSLLECSLCGATLVACSGSRTRPGFRCSSYHRRGSCRNGLRALVTAVDEAIIDAVARALEPATIEAAVREAVQIRTAGLADADAKRSALTAELAGIDARIHRLVSALADGDEGVQAIRDRLRAEQARRDTVAAELASAATAPSIDVAGLTAALTARARDIRGVLKRHPGQTRQALRLVLGGARFIGEPFDDHRGKGYRFTATGSYRHLGVKGLEAITVGYTGHAARNQA